MKVMKKISAVLLSLCLMVPCFSMVALAADGRISFTDPSTAVGEYVEVKCVLRSTSGNMGDVSVDLSYDEAYLRFDSGDGVESTGSGSLSCQGTASSAEVAFVAKFQALQEGTTKVEITGATVSDSNGATLTLDQGNSTVTIAAGDPSKIVDTDTAVDSQAAELQVEVNGVSYTLTNEFADADIPTGYARIQKSIDGTDYYMAGNESGNVCLGYMIDAEGNGDFFLYVEEVAAFYPYAEIFISDTTSIVVLSDASQVSLPDTYKEAKLSLNSKEFPVWQDTEKEGIYVIYAMNNSGEIGYYQYDSVEGTYQRITPSAQAPVEESVEETDDSSVLGKIQNLIMANFMIVLLAAGVVGFIVLIILIVLAVKLHNRNAEIDELYDEYGIDLEEEEEVPAKQEVKKEAKKAKKAKKKEAVEEEDSFEEAVEEDFEEEKFEEEFFEEDFAEEDFAEEDFAEEDFTEEDFYEEDFAEADFEDYREPQDEVVKYKQEEEFTGYTERMDFTIDDLDELLEEKTGKKTGHIEDDDTFKMDFIDLD